MSSHYPFLLLTQSGLLCAVTSQSYLYHFDGKGPKLLQRILVLARQIASNLIPSDNFGGYDIGNLVFLLLYCTHG